MKEASMREEAINVKGQAEPIILSVAETVHGPIVSQCAGDHGTAYEAAKYAGDSGEQDEAEAGVTLELAFCAKGLAERTGAMEALYQLGHATDVISARAAFEHVSAPSLNIGLGTSLFVPANMCRIFVVYVTAAPFYTQPHVLVYVLYCTSSMKRHSDGFGLVVAAAFLVLVA